MEPTLVCNLEIGRWAQILLCSVFYDSVFHSAFHKLSEDLKNKFISFSAIKLSLQTAISASRNVKSANFFL